MKNIACRHQIQVTTAERRALYGTAEKAKTPETQTLQVVSEENDSNTLDKEVATFIDKTKAFCKKSQCGTEVEELFIEKLLEKYTIYKQRKASLTGAQTDEEQQVLRPHEKEVREHLKNSEERYEMIKQLIELKEVKTPAEAKDFLSSTEVNLGGKKIRLTEGLTSFRNEMARLMRARAGHAYAFLKYKFTTEANVKKKGNNDKLQVIARALSSKVDIRRVNDTFEFYTTGLRAEKLKEEDVITILQEDLHKGFDGKVIDFDAIPKESVVYKELKQKSDLMKETEANFKMKVRENWTFEKIIAWLVAFVSEMLRQGDKYDFFEAASNAHLKLAAPKLEIKGDAEEITEKQKNKGDAFVFTYTDDEVDSLLIDKKSKTARKLLCFKLGIEPEEFERITITKINTNDNVIEATLGEKKEAETEKDKSKSTRKPLETMQISPNEIPEEVNNKGYWELWSNMSKEQMDFTRKVLLPYCTTGDIKKAQAQLNHSEPAILLLMLSMADDASIGGKKDSPKKIFSSAARNYDAATNSDHKVGLAFDVINTDYNLAAKHIINAVGDKNIPKNLSELLSGGYQSGDFWMLVHENSSGNGKHLHVSYRPGKKALRHHPDGTEMKQNPFKDSRNYNEYVTVASNTWDQQKEKGDYKGSRRDIVDKPRLT